MNLGFQIEHTYDGHQEVSPMGFDGFAEAGLQFLHELADNNTRDWWQANKRRYEEGLIGPCLRCAMLKRFTAGPSILWNLSSRVATVNRSATIVPLLLVGLVLPQEAHGKEKWERIMNEEGIRVWRKSVEGSALVHFRGRAIIKASLAKVIAVISGADRLCEWRSNCVKAYKLAEAAGDRQYVYYRVESPAPFVADRDVVVDATCKKAGAGGIKCRFRSVSHPKDPAPTDAVRMPKLRGYWQLMPKGDGATEATYEVVADPGGWIPKWLANLASKRLPFKALQGLRKQVKVDYSASEASIAAKLARLGL